jgi:hypothetical protein
MYFQPIDRCNFIMHVCVSIVKTFFICCGADGTSNVTQYICSTTDQLLRENTSVSGGQIAIRFPGDNTSGNNFGVPKDWERHWHIDGLGDNKVNGRQSFFGDIRNFTALVI